MQIQIKKVQLPRLLDGKKGSFAKERWRRYLVALDGGREGWSTERNILLACLRSFLSYVDDDFNDDGDGVDDDDDYVLLLLHLFHTTNPLSLSAAVGTLLVQLVEQRYCEPFFSP